MIKYIFICSLMLVTGFCRAGEVTADSKQEIEHLFNFMETSGCQFNRNGSWYSGAEAAAHIRKKYEYLINKKMLTDAESFIDKAASESSFSGKPYVVKCAGKADTTSALWFKQELDAYRVAAKSQT
ncbi:MAG TPA: DUF5329 domain-containing protein [Cellvibrio sp.]|nr:DUF5329 domain-containing protein [Cellvibrio sp.]